MSGVYLKKRDRTREKIGQKRLLVNWLDSSDYRSPTDPKTISTVEAFGHAARRGPHAAQVWLTRLAEIDVSRHVQPLFDNIPEARMAQHAAAFAMRMLELNRQRLLEQYKEST